ncbi:hypothetical protein HON22_02900 [Candidatus Peregrinibacteria bacterium]|jgi:hypothetical protein|nr:hypothetical protein [Candidatus Peregrinibacteria bacterium]
MNKKSISEENTEKILEELDMVDKSFTDLTPELQNFVRYNNDIGQSMMRLHNRIINLACFYTHSCEDDLKITSLAMTRSMEDGRCYWNYILGDKPQEPEPLSRRINEIHEKLEDVYMLLCEVQDPSYMHIFHEKLSHLVLNDRAILSYS